MLKVRRAPGTLASAHRPARACRVFVDKNCTELVNKLLTRKRQIVQTAFSNTTSAGQTPLYVRSRFAKVVLPRGRGQISLLKSRRPLIYVYYPRVWHEVWQPPHLRAWQPPHCTSCHREPGPLRAPKTVSCRCRSYDTIVDTTQSSPHQLRRSRGREI